MEYQSFTSVWLHWRHILIPRPSPVRKQSHSKIDLNQDIPTLQSYWHLGPNKSLIRQGVRWGGGCPMQCSTVSNIFGLCPLVANPTGDNQICVQTFQCSLAIKLSQLRSTGLVKSILWGRKRWSPLNLWNAWRDKHLNKIRIFLGKRKS